ncbi:hypothetical protein [Microbulbifer sp. VAAF005]|uniref:hypothetical protein n=1 Tax=Microbulbifer sp. VAAF005 TaxID=3034230 RepID=UPI0024AD9EAF|nr:hypothetical protein [Microbulbifer sp. VAAF005]WHI46204.1 hypothetical protein P0078_21180 [Microbulbifer sp. VAAF005]
MPPAGLAGASQQIPADRRICASIFWRRLNSSGRTTANSIEAAQGSAARRLGRREPVNTSRSTHLRQYFLATFE